MAATEPDDETRERLVRICGDQFASGPVCCDSAQLDNLETNLKKAENIIASCPACKHNFFQFFCTFTCSSNQSQFVEIVDTSQSRQKKEIVDELNYYVDPASASDFYDSCKDVKFSATNGYAMDLIGGGAKNYKDFLKFLGDKKPLLGGSPFQMNFYWSSQPHDIERSVQDAKPCNDPDYKCACTDCDISCPTLDPVKRIGDEYDFSCKIGMAPCASVLAVVIYILLIGMGLGWIAFEQFWSSLASKYFTSANLLHDDDDSEERRTGVSNRRISYDDDDNDQFWSRFQRTDFLRSPYRLNSYLQRSFTQIGLFCARFPLTVIVSSLAIIVLMSLGSLKFQLETDPVGLWVSSDSQEFKEKAHFEQAFGPFYRGEQLYLVNDTGSILSSYETMEWWFDVENTITQKLTSEDGVKFDDICFKPLGVDSACVIQSMTQYFGGNIAGLPKSQWHRKIESCAATPVNCLPPFQQPLKKDMVYGGAEKDDILSSKALVISLVVNNHLDDKDNRDAMSWENKLQDFLLQEVVPAAKERGLRLSFMTESSLEQELNKSSNTDSQIIVISYLVMFLYASLALGGILPLAGYRYLVRSKFSLGLFGIFVVIMSVAASVGIFSLFGIKATLIIAEVIPFLVLAIGVDNIFLLSHELELTNVSYPEATREERISKAVGQTGPSILLSTLCEAITFSLGATVPMPAVRNFAVYSAGAVVINSALQLTMFVAAMSLDLRRVESNRIDCMPFIKAPKPKAMYRESLSALTARLCNRTANGSNSASANASLIIFEDRERMSLSKLIRDYYAPFLLRENVKRLVLLIFGTWFTFCMIITPFMEAGLDQRDAVPNDSYLVEYFDDLYDYFESGPPVYFVTQDLNVTARQGQQRLCGRFTTCDEFSLTNILEQERKRGSISYINEPATSWIDDYLQWLNPELEECCRFRKGTNETQMCSPLASPRNCDVCYADKDYDLTMQNFPEGEEFLKYFKFWIEAPSDPCPLGGKAAHGTSIVPDFDRTTIDTSFFRTSHIPLRSQSDFIRSYSNARRIADSITEKSGVHTYPYSKHYIFFAQYRTIYSDATILVLGALLLDFLVAMAILGSVRTAFVLILTVGMIVTTVTGMAMINGIELNAVSLVNLVICVGLGVEFCAHIARAFTFAPKINSVGLAAATRNTRALHALSTIGGSVFGGIALTKFIGVCVLAFTTSKIFDIYYYRMWLTLVISATLHSLVFLPVALSYMGGSGYLLDLDQGLANDLASRAFDEVADEDY